MATIAHYDYTTYAPTVDVGQRLYFYAALHVEYRTPMTNVYWAQHSTFAVVRCTAVRNMHYCVVRGHAVTNAETTAELILHARLTRIALSLCDAHTNAFSDRQALASATSAQLHCTTKSRHVLEWSLVHERGQISSWNAHISVNTKWPLTWKIDVCLNCKRQQHSCSCLVSISVRRHTCNI
jgi:hypothetical protein